MSVKKIKVVNIRKFLIAFSIFFATAACAAPPVLMGKCGASLNFMRKGVILEDDHALSGIGVINFDNKTVVGSIISYNSKNSKKTSLTNLNWMFEIKEGYFDGSALLVPLNDSKKPTIQILPVNNGNSYLLQIIDTDAVGVCQKS